MRFMLAVVQIGFALGVLSSVDRIVSGEAACVESTDVVGLMWTGIAAAALFLATAAFLIYRREP